MKLLHTKDEIYNLWNISMFIKNTNISIERYKLNLRKSRFQIDFKVINSQLQEYKKIIQPELNKYNVYLGTKVIKTSIGYSREDYAHIGKEGEITKIIEFSPSGVFVEFICKDGYRSKEELYMLKKG